MHDGQVVPDRASFPKRSWDQTSSKVVSVCDCPMVPNGAHEAKSFNPSVKGIEAALYLLKHQGLVSFSDRDSILERVDFVGRTDQEDVHMNVEAALADLIGEPAKKLHTARS
ncbi:hypothetical protein L6452_21324 [Arctium lappa]|uniref:Uncharacterized protein n=1 Tax=Arctium lappa TaxID=4217 RepID=A0ACB9BFS3_ARCLA|nr:hypothetical protein L6452_21324 [Arctium lappa]